MSDYSKLVKALRLETDYVAVEKTMRDAAAAIEALQAEVKRLNMRCADCEYASKPWPELEPKRGEWIWIQKENGGQYKGCSVCHAPIPTDSMLDYLDNEDCDFCYSCGAKMEVQE